MRLGGAALAALLLATPSAAQLGTATQSPPPEGVAEGEGAAFPKGDYAALDALPDWGGIWFVMFGASNNQSTAAPQPKGEYAELRAQWLARPLREGARGWGYSAPLFSLQLHPPLNPLPSR
jgi:hypothetical protein